MNATIMHLGNLANQCKVDIFAFTFGRQRLPTGMRMGGCFNYFIKYYFLDSNAIYASCTHNNVWVQPIPLCFSVVVRRH